MKRIVVGVSGASGGPLAFALLEALRAVKEPDEVEIHLIVSEPAKIVLKKEGAGLGGANHEPHALDKLCALAHARYGAWDFAAPPASGSWRHGGMVVCPCSMASLGAIANGCGSNLIHRAADVAIKERFPLVLVPRETPLSRVHLANMLKAAEAGCVIMPPCPAFYAEDGDPNALVRHFCNRVLDQLGLVPAGIKRWGEA